MLLDTNLQFDILPIKIKKTEIPQSCTSKMNSNMEAYFRDQRLKQANKAQSKVQNISSNASNTLIKKSKKEFKTVSLSIALNIIEITEENVEKMKHFKEEKANQNNWQEKTQCFKQEKENRSNQPETILVLRLKKLCIRKNQRNLQEKT